MVATTASSSSDECCATLEAEPAVATADHRLPRALRSNILGDGIRSAAAAALRSESFVAEPSASNINLISFVAPSRHAPEPVRPPVDALNEDARFQALLELLSVDDETMEPEAPGVADQLMDELLDSVSG